MLPIDTSPPADEFDPTEDELTTTSFRQQLEKTAPPLLDKFDWIINNKNVQIEEFGRKYNQAKADFVRQNATAKSDSNASTTGDKRSGSTSHAAVSTGDTEISRVSEYHRPPSQGSNLHVSTATKAQHRMPLAGSTRNNSTSHKSVTSRTSLGAAKASEMILDMKVKVRLIPVIKLLTNNDEITPAIRAQAKSLAHSALNFANKNHASHALTARCSYYIAHTHYDRANNTTVQDAVNWFQRATEASEAGYPEGQWAQEWLNRYYSLTMVDDSRPSTAGSWVASKIGAIWNMVLGRKGSAVSASPSSVSPVGTKPHPWPISRHYSLDSAPFLARRPRGYARIPSFTTMNSSNFTGSVTNAKDQTNGPTWSPKSDWGKNEVLQGRRSDLVQSPEPIREAQDEDDTPQEHMPANILGGFVQASALSPAMQRSPTSRADLYIPQSLSAPPAAQQWRNTNNLTSPPESPHSPGTNGNNATVQAQHSFLSRAPNYNPAHSRAHSTALPPPIPMFSPTPYAHSDSGTRSPTTQLRNRKRSSISHLIRTTVLNVSARPDEAAQMEEGESPFMPRREERKFYDRRVKGSDDDDGIVEEEDKGIGETY